MTVRGIGCWLVVGLVCGSAVAGSAVGSKQTAPRWTLTWSDEFNAPDGTAPDPAKWAFDVGGHGWGNNQLESDTARPENAVQEGGNLVLTARKEEYTDAGGHLRHYTSARMKSLGQFAQTYGRFEARMKLPAGKGIWPAFWMLGDNIASAGWPQGGEIDVVETIGNPREMYSTVHGPGYSGAKGLSQKFELPAGEAVDTGFHLYAVEWTPKTIKFFFDDKLIVEQTTKSLPTGATWVFDHPFFVLLDLAVGGYWPGEPDAATTFPKQMLVDYVRVYKAAR
jgi:beta-glucanase (GH16 family)